jgi:CHASE3 domain sensor protein
MITQPVRSRPRRAFTITELLVSLALIIFIMSILSAAFTEGLETFRQMKGAGDMSEKLRAAAVKLRADVDETNSRTSEFILTGLLNGKVDPATAADLKGRYESIRDEAADLEPQLHEVERATKNPAARRVMQMTIKALVGIKENASRAIEILDLLDG